MDLSVIIVNWNVQELLKKCLASIERTTKNLSHEVFVIDNGSSDGSADMVRKQFPSVNLIALDRTIGFAEANDQAIQKAQGEFVLLLNPDTEIMEGALTTTIRFMKEKPQCGIAGCKLLNTDKTLQPSVRRFPTLAAMAFIFLKMHHVAPNHPALKKYFAKDFDYEQEQTVDQVMGAFFMVRKKVFDAIGLLDKDYYIWFEEVDFCKRAKNKNWQVYYTPRATIVHHKAKSFVQQSAVRKQIWFNDSAIRYFIKHDTPASALALLALYPISIVLALIVDLTKSHD